MTKTAIAPSPSYQSPLLRCAVFFFIALVARLAYLSQSGVPSQAGSDPIEYITLASNLARGLGFTYDGSVPSTYRPPLFSALLGAWCYLLNSTALPTMVAYQVLVQTLCAPLTYLLVRHAQSNESVALAGGLFVAVYPFILNSVGMVLQEPTQMLVASLIGLAVVAWGRQPTLWRAAVVGVLFGLGGLAKSPFLFGPPIILFVCVTTSGLHRRLPLRQASLACLVTVLVVLPWTVRNYRVSGGRWIPINSQNVAFSTWMVADGNYVIQESSSDRRAEAITLEKGSLLSYGNPDGVAYLRLKNDELLKNGVTQPLIAEALGKASTAYLIEHPFYVLAKTMRGLVLLLSPDASEALTPFLKTRILAMMVFHLPLAGGVFVGVLASLRGKDQVLVILSLFTAAYLLAHAPVAVAGGRYSVPVLPLMIAITGRVVFGERAHHGDSTAGAIFRGHRFSKLWRSRAAEVDRHVSAHLSLTGASPEPASGA